MPFLFFVKNLIPGNRQFPPSFRRLGCWLPFIVNVYYKPEVFVRERKTKAKETWGALFRWEKEASQYKKYYYEEKLLWSTL